MKLAEKGAVVTGAGSGIGRASALLFATEGARVALLGRTESELNSTRDEILKLGSIAESFACDISDAPEVERAITAAGRTWSRIDIVFANAGINGVWAPLDELTPEEWDKTLSINLRGTFLTVKYALPFLKERGGSIVITSSVNGNRIFSNTGATAYSCSKAGQVAFTKMAALELAKHRVRVNVICPGAIETEIGANTEERDLNREKEPVVFSSGRIPLTRGQSGSAQDVAALALFLASDDSKHITGTEVYIDGGESLLQG